MAFKPNTDDIREAPALSIIRALTNEGATITACNLEAMLNEKAKIRDKINYADNQYHALVGAEVLIIATEWSDFRTPYFDQVDKLVKDKVLFDGRNLFELPMIKELGYHYGIIGRSHLN